MSAYTSLTNSMIELSLDSIATQQTVQSLNSCLTDDNQKLTYYWTTCPESNPDDPGYAAYTDLMAIGIGNWNTTPGNGSQDMQGWINKYLDGSGQNLYFSSAFMTQVENVYMQNQPPSQNNSPLGIISNVANLISAAAQADEQKVQSQISTLNTLAQHFESDQGPLSSTTQTLLDTANNYSSAMSQISA